MKARNLHSYNTGLLVFFGIVLFTPSITFSIIPAEIFPWALLFSLLYIKKISLNDIVIFSIFFLYSIYSLFLYADISETVRSFISYMNVILIFMLISNSKFTNFESLLNIFRLYFISLCVFGIFQYLGLIGFLEPFLQALIPRASSDALSEIGRGITLLSSEPSRAAYEFVFMYALFRFFFIKNYKLIFDVLLIIFVIFFIQSAMGAFLIFFFLVIYYRLKFIVPISVISIFFGAYLLNVEGGGRAVSVTQSIISMSSFDGILSFLLDASGFRLVSIYASFSSLFEYWFGHGIGSWRESSILALETTGINPSDLSYFVVNGDGNWVPIRPTAPFFALLLDFGFFVFIVMYFLFYKLKKITKFSREGRNIVFLFIAYFMTMGAIGNPIPWIALAFVISYEIYQRDSNAY